jgi:PhoH-like ATPase
MIDLIIPADLIDNLYKDGKLEVEGLDFQPSENESFILKDEADPKKSALVIYKPYFIRPPGLDKVVQGIRGKDARQRLFLSSLVDDDILMSVALGRAGTGKTLLAIAYALERYFKENKAIILIKPSVFVGGKSQVIAALPGDENDKLAGVMASYMVHFNALLGHKASFMVEDMLSKGMLKYLPIETARGMSLENCTCILDESQNTDFHTMKTIVSRVSSSSKLIVLGDLSQIDVPKLDYKDTGLYLFLNSKLFKDSKYTSVITLTAQYRSPLADLAENIHDELRGDFRS